MYAPLESPTAPPVACYSDEPRLFSTSNKHCVPNRAFGTRMAASVCSYVCRQLPSTSVRGLPTCYIFYIRVVGRRSTAILNMFGNVGMIFLTDMKFCADPTLFPLAPYYLQQFGIIQRVLSGTRARFFELVQQERFWHYTVQGDRSLSHPFSQHAWAQFHAADHPYYRSVYSITDGRNFLTGRDKYEAHAETLAILGARATKLGVSECQMMRSWPFLDKDNEETVDMDITAARYVQAKHVEYWLHVERQEESGGVVGPPPTTYLAPNAVVMSVLQADAIIRHIIAQDKLCRERLQCKIELGKRFSDLPAVVRIPARYLGVSVDKDVSVAPHVAINLADGDNECREVFIDHILQACCIRSTNDRAALRVLINLARAIENEIETRFGDYPAITNTIQMMVDATEANLVSGPPVRRAPDESPMSFANRSLAASQGAAVSTTMYDRTLLAMPIETPADVLAARRETHTPLDSGAAQQSKRHDESSQQFLERSLKRFGVTQPSSSPAKASSSVRSQSHPGTTPARTWSSPSPDPTIDICIPDMPIAVPVPSDVRMTTECYPVDESISYPTAAELEELRALRELRRTEVALQTAAGSASQATAEQQHGHAMKYLQKYLDGSQGDLPNTRT